MRKKIDNATQQLRTVEDCRDYLYEHERLLTVCGLPFSGKVAGLLSRRLCKDFKLGPIQVRYRGDHERQP